MSKKLEVLKVFMDGKERSIPATAKEVGMPRRVCNVYILRLEEAGLLRRNYSGGTAYFRLLDESNPEVIQDETVVQRAMRTVPNSVFALGAM